MALPIEKGVYLDDLLPELPIMTILHKQGRVGMNSLEAKTNHG